MINHVLEYLPLYCFGAILLMCPFIVRHNLKLMSETKQTRLEARRAYKRQKNSDLARFYAIKNYKTED